MASASTLPFAPVPTSKPVSMLPSEFSRAMRLRDTPAMVWNEPPAMTLPPATVCSAFTVLLAAGLKPVSLAPAEVSRAMRVRVAPLQLRKSPPITTFPSDCKASAYTWASAPLLGAKDESEVPSVLSRVIRPRVTPAMVVKLPPTRILPLESMASARTRLFGAGLNAVSSAPVASTRAM